MFSQILLALLFVYLIGVICVFLFFCLRELQWTYATGLDLAATCILSLFSFYIFFEIIQMYQGNEKCPIIDYVIEKLGNYQNTHDNKLSKFLSKNLYI